MQATAPSLTEKSDKGPPSRNVDISVEPPPISTLILVTPRAAQPCEAASPINRASSMPERISTWIPVCL